MAGRPWDGREDVTLVGSEAQAPPRLPLGRDTLGQQGSPPFLWVGGLALVLWLCRGHL